MQHSSEIRWMVRLVSSARSYCSIPLDKVPRLLLSLGLIVFLLTSCSAPAAPIASTEVEPSPEPTMTSQSLDGSLELDVAYGSGPFDLPDTKAGLSDLSSYKATLNLTFDGMRNGTTEQWSKTWVMLATKEPFARQLTIETEGDIANAERVFMAELDGIEYEKVGETGCTASPIVQGNSTSGNLEPAELLNFVIGADEAGNETIDNVPTNHYTFNQLALGQQDLTESTGELWVASAGGYIVKYALTSKGDARFFGKGIEGTISFHYELTDVNQPVEIVIPEDCPPGLVDAPLLPDASNTLNMGGVLQYDTSNSLADAVAFYQEQIPKLGWEQQADPAIQESLAFLTYVQAEKLLTIVILSAEGNTKVRIMLSKMQ